MCSLEVSREFKYIFSTFFSKSDSVGFHVSVGKPVCSMEVQWEEMSSVAEFEYDREERMASARGFSKNPEQREC